MENLILNSLPTVRERYVPLMGLSAASPPCPPPSFSPLCLPLVLSFFLPLSLSSDPFQLSPHSRWEDEECTSFWLKSIALRKHSQLMILPFPAGDDVYLHLGTGGERLSCASLSPGKLQQYMRGPPSPRCGASAGLRLCAAPNEGALEGRVGKERV